MAMRVLGILPNSSRRFTRPSARTATTARFGLNTPLQPSPLQDDLTPAYDQLVTLYRSFQADGFPAVKQTLESMGHDPVRDWTAPEARYQFERNGLTPAQADPMDTYLDDPRQLSFHLDLTRHRHGNVEGPHLDITHYDPARGRGRNRDKLRWPLVAEGGHFVRRDKSISGIRL